jgi:hypothetical protein
MTNIVATGISSKLNDAAKQTVRDNIGFDAGVLKYNQFMESLKKKATLWLDFANNEHKVYEQYGLTTKVLTDAITTARASNATYDAPTGIATAAANIPRITYDPLSGVCLGLETEEARTNLLLRSQEFDNASWTKQAGATVAPNTTTAPDGTLTADTLTTNNGVSMHQGVTATVSTIYCQSVYIKAGTITRVMVRDDAGVGRHIVVNPLTGAITSTSGTLVASGVDPLPDGWFRVWFSYVADTTSVRMNIRSDAENAATVILWGAQVEAGSFPTSYIPTTTAAQLRIADGITKTISGSTEGTAFVVCRGAAPVNGSNQVAFYLSDGTINNRALVRRNNSINGSSALIVTAGTVVFNPASTQKQAGQVTVLAISWKANQFIFADNGVIVSQVNTGAAPIGMNTIGIGNVGVPAMGGESLNGSIDLLCVIPRALTAAELQQVKL